VSFLREESNLHPFSKRRGDTSQHCQRMSLIIGIFQATDHPSGGALQFHQWPLGEASFGAKIIELLGQLGVCESLFVGGYLLGVIADVAVLRILERLRCELLYSCHYESSDPNVYRVGFGVNLFFLWIARSTYRRETRCSLAMTREPTVARLS
jgi:hypothetical protein